MKTEALTTFPGSGNSLPGGGTVPSLIPNEGAVTMSVGARLYGRFQSRSWTYLDDYNNTPNGDTVVVSTFPQHGTVTLRKIRTLTHHPAPQRYIHPSGVAITAIYPPFSAAAHGQSCGTIVHAGGETYNLQYGWIPTGKADGTTTDFELFMFASTDTTPGAPFASPVVEWETIAATNGSTVSTSNGQVTQSGPFGLGWKGVSATSNGTTFVNNNPGTGDDYSFTISPFADDALRGTISDPMRANYCADGGNDVGVGNGGAVGEGTKSYSTEICVTVTEVSAGYTFNAASTFDINPICTTRDDGDDNDSAGLDTRDCIDLFVGDATTRPQHIDLLNSGASIGAVDIATATINRVVLDAQSLPNLLNLVSDGSAQTAVSPGTLDFTGNAPIGSFRAGYSSVARNGNVVTLGGDATTSASNIPADAQTFTLTRGATVGSGEVRISNTAAAGGAYAEGAMIDSDRTNIHVHFENQTVRDMFSTGGHRTGFLMVFFSNGNYMIGEIQGSGNNPYLIIEVGDENTGNDFSVWDGVYPADGATVTIAFRAIPTERFPVPTTGETTFGDVTITNGLGNWGTAGSGNLCDNNSGGGVTTGGDARVGGNVDVGRDLNVSGQTTLSGISGDGLLRIDDAGVVTAANTVPVIERDSVGGQHGLIFADMTPFPGDGVAGLTELDISQHIHFTPNTRTLSIVGTGTGGTARGGLSVGVDQEGDGLVVATAGTTIAGQSVIIRDTKSTQTIVPGATATPNLLGISQVGNAQTGALTTQNIPIAITNTGVEVTGDLTATGNISGQLEIPTVNAGGTTTSTAGYNIVIVPSGTNDYK